MRLLRDDDSPDAEDDRADATGPDGAATLLRPRSSEEWLRAHQHVSGPAPAAPGRIPSADVP